MADRYDYENRGRGWRDMNDEEDSDWQDNPARYERDNAWNRDTNRSYERDSRWDRTRQWRSGQNPQQRGRGGAISYGSQGDWRGSDARQGMNADRDRYARNEYDRRDEPIYNRDWYDWNFDRDEDNDSYGNDADSGWSSRWQGDRFSDSGQRGRPMNRGRYSQQNQPYPTAGMNSDFSGQYDYEDRQRRQERLNYSQGDIGYDNEGAFYQDMDEPVNYEYWEIRTIPGNFTGMGPEGYQRNDDRIEEDICERLTEHGWVDARDVEVQVKDGEVTLKGTVPDRNMKRLAEDIADDVSGVKDIHNELKVQGRQSGRDRDRYQQNRSRDPGTRDWESRWPEGVENSMAGQTNAGAGLTDAGATSLMGMEAGSGMDEKRSSLREGMEVIGNNGKVAGRVKEIRTGDFLLDREMARDVYVPNGAIQSVGAQVMINIPAEDIDKQGWPNPDLL